MAVSAVVDSISKTDVLSPFINDGDKEPSWDGNIYIYEDKRKKKDGIKKVPVQVKGERRKRIPPKKAPKFSVEIIDLDNWLNDGGVVLFVVLIDESGENKAIYYSSLLPVLIRHLKKFARGKKRLSVPLKEFPRDNNRKVGVLLDFYSHMQKQTSFARAPLYTADELTKEGVLENITLTVTAYGKRSDNIDVESLLLQNDIYMYAKIKGSAIPQPLPDIPMDLHIAKDVHADIRVKDQVFYKTYRVVKSVEATNILFGRSFDFKVDVENKKSSVNFRLKGTLSDYIRDTECIIAIIENREISFNGALFHFDDIGDADIERYRENLRYYKDVQKMLNLLGVKKELECGNLSDQDQNNIRNFTNSLVYGRNIGFPGQERDMVYGRFKIANLTILIWADNCVF